MCKKLFVAALLAVTGYGVYAHFDLGKYFRDDSLEARIKRERKQLADLDKEIKQLIHAVASREVELQDLDREIVSLEKQKGETLKSLTAREAELKTVLVKETRKSEAERQRQLRDVSRLADNFERLDATLKARKEQREASQDALQASHDELLAYQNERRALETELTQLDATVAQMRAEEVRSRVHFDKSKLAESTERIAELRKQVEVRRKDRELQTKYLGGSTTPAAPALSEAEVLEKVKRLTSAE